MNKDRDRERREEQIKNNRRRLQVPAKESRYDTRDATMGDFRSAGLVPVEVLLDTFCFLRDLANSEHETPSGYAKLLYEQLLSHVDAPYIRRPPNGLEFMRRTLAENIYQRVTGTTRKDRAIEEIDRELRWSGQGYVAMEPAWFACFGNSLISIPRPPSGNLTRGELIRLPYFGAGNSLNYALATVENLATSWDDNDQVWRILVTCTQVFPKELQRGGPHITEIIMEELEECPKTPPNSPPS